MTPGGEPRVFLSSGAPFLGLITTARAKGSAKDEVFDRKVLTKVRNFPKKGNCKIRGFLMPGSCYNYVVKFPERKSTGSKLSPVSVYWIQTVSFRGIRSDASANPVEPSG